MDGLTQDGHKAMTKLACWPLASGPKKEIDCKRKCTFSRPIVQSVVESSLYASNLPFLKQALVFTCRWYNSFENTVGKGEIALNKQFLLFPECFLPVWRTFCHFYET